MRRQILLLSCLLSLPVTALASPKIFHGATVTSDTQYPFVVAIYDKEGSRADCTGTVIGDRWILTAEHCVINFSPEDDDNATPKLHQPEDLQVGTGHLAANKSAANKVFSVKNIYVPNNQIDMTLTRDVAILETVEPLNITPVSLPKPHDVFPDLKSGTQMATAIGYGFTDLKFSAECAQYPDDEEKCQLTNVTYDDYLHYGKELLQSDSDTVITIDKIMKLVPAEPGDIEIQYNPVTMLASISPDGTSVTNGDSGGPLLIETKSANNEPGMMQIGVNSWGAPTPGSYAAFKLMNQHLDVDVYALLSDPVTIDFIHSIITKH